MIWFILLTAALLSFAAAAFLLKLPRALWPLFGAFLMLALAAYSLSGSPDLPAAPKTEAVTNKDLALSQVEARRSFFGSTLPPSKFVMMADGYSRRGKYAEAADLLRGAVSANPKDAEAWTALGIALVEHADGAMNGAAIYAFKRAESIAPENPAPQYFVSLSLLREGKLAEMRDIWARLLAKAKPGDEWRKPLETQLGRLDYLLSEMEKMRAAQSLQRK